MNSDTRENYRASTNYCIPSNLHLPEISRLLPNPMSQNNGIQPDGRVLIYSYLGAIDYTPAYYHAGSQLGTE